MKIVDEKGKIFGKLNIIDLLVLVLIAAAVVLVGLKLMGNNGAVAAGGTRLTYTVEVTTVDPVVYDEIQKELQKGPSQLMANGALVDGYVTAVTSVPHVNYGIDDAGHVQTSVEQNGRVDLVFTIEANVLNAVTSEVGTQEVRIGKTHIVKTVQFELVNGVIATCERVPLTEG